MKLRTKVFAVLALAGTMLFGGALTANAYMYTPENCSHIKKQEDAKKYNRPDYNNTFREIGVKNKKANMCSYCGLECSHPLQYRTYPSDPGPSDYYYSNGKHYLKGHCTFCNSGNLSAGMKGLTNNHSPLIDTSKGQACKKVCKQDNAQPNKADTHTTTCSVCGNAKTAKCSFNITYKPEYYGSGSNKSQISDNHEIIYKCKSCKMGKTYGTHWAKHTFKNNKCTKCSYKIIIPKNTSITSAKQSGKPKTGSVTLGGFWQKTYVGSSGAKWKWIPKTKASYKSYSIKIKLKKATDAQAYLVSTNSKFTGNSTQRFTGTSFTYKYTVGKKSKPKKVKLYITTVSKTGNYGKTINKTIKLKN